MARAFQIGVVALAAGCGSGAAGPGEPSGGGNAGGGPLTVGATVGGSLEPGRGGTTTHAFTVAPDTWYQVTLDATATTAILVHTGEPLDASTLAVQCVAQRCVVDFVTTPTASSYLIWLANYSTKSVQYDLRAKALEIQPLSAAGSATGAVVGKASVYHRFDVPAVGRYEVTLSLLPTAATPVAVNLYDAANVWSDLAFLTFTWADSPDEPRGADLELSPDEGPLFLKVKNLPDPFDVEFDIEVPYTIEVSPW